MAQVYNRLTLDVKKKNHDIITAVQHDASSRYLDINLIDNGVNINLTGHEVRLYAKKPDQTEVYNNGQITNAAQGRVQIELTSQLLSKEGYVEAQVVIFKNNQQILSSLPFRIHVVKNLMSDNAIESSNEYGALTVLFQNLYEAHALMTTMIDKIGVPGLNAQNLNLDTMFGVWDYLIGYMQSNSTEGISEKIGLPSNAPGAGTLFGAIKNTPDHGGFHVFISNGVFIVPPGVKQIRVTGCAAGGNGADGTATSAGAGGKAGDGVVGKIIDVTPGETLTVVCGGGNTILGNKLTLLANNFANSIPIRLEIMGAMETGKRPGNLNSNGHGGYFGFGGGGGGNAQNQYYAGTYEGSCGGGGGGAGGYGAGGGGGGAATPNDPKSRPGQGGRGYTGQSGAGGVSAVDPTRNGGNGGNGAAYGSGGGGGGSYNGYGGGSATMGQAGSGDYAGQGGASGNHGGIGGGTDTSRVGKPGGNGVSPPDLPFGGVPGQGFLYIEW